MQSIKRWLFLSVSLCMLVLTGVRSWGISFNGIGTGPILVQAQEQPKQEQAKSATFTGTIVRDGEQFVLHESSGGVYKLDDSERAQAFEGKAVKVTGKLDKEAKLIHVESIEAA
jgi:hypothetical protein